MQSRELVKELLNKFGVAVLAGASFGDAGENYLSFSFFMAPETIEEGMNKVKASKKHRESGRPTHLHTQLDFFLLKVVHYILALQGAFRLFSIDVRLLSDNQTATC